MPSVLFKKMFGCTRSKLELVRP